jgi:transcriptional regulator with XRE-family HTH domain
VSELIEQVNAGAGLIEELRQSFTDEEYRNAYAESFLNSYVAGQIKVLREEYPMTQGELAEKVGTKQPGIARLENVNYSAWKVESLRKLARALNVRLRITFEEWGTLPGEIENFRKDALKRAPFAKDPVFFPRLNLGRIEDLPAKKAPRNDDIGCGALEPELRKGAAQQGAARAERVSGLAEAI